MMVNISQQKERPRLRQQAGSGSEKPNGQMERLEYHSMCKRHLGEVMTQQSEGYLHEAAVKERGWGP